MHNLGRRYGAYGGWCASNGPSQNLVDDYNMTNGELPFIYSGSGASYKKTINPEPGYDPQNPYAKRDHRLDAPVIHDESGYTIFKTQRLVKTKIKLVGADAIYATNKNRKFLTAQGIATDFKRKGKAGKHEQRRRKLAGAITKERASRLEGSFGKDKEHYHLKRIRARTKPTEILWIFFGIHIGECTGDGKTHLSGPSATSSLNSLFVYNLPGEGASCTQKNWPKNVYYTKDPGMINKGHKKSQKVV